MIDLYRLVPSPIKKLVPPTFFRYGIMAVTVVAIELASFWLMDSVLHIHYLVATVASLIIGILLNWIGSRYYVFGQSNHTAHKEFLLVVASSLAGAALQSAVVYTTVEVINGQPLIGKSIAIIITFFWNYIIRKKYIYNKDADSNSTKLETVLLKACVGILLFCAVFAVLYWRYPNSITHANFYAEDGSVFYQNIVNKGWLGATLTPFNGYSIIGLYLLEALGYIFNLFVGGSILTLPATLAATSIAFTAFVLCLPYYLFKEKFGNLQMALVVACSALMPLPISPHVVLGTIGNEKWLFFYLAFLLVMHQIVYYAQLGWKRILVSNLIILICAYTNSTVYGIVPLLLLPPITHYVHLRRKPSIASYILQWLRNAPAKMTLGLYLLLLPQVLYVLLNGIPKLPGYLDTPFVRSTFIEIFVNRTYIYGLTHLVNGHMSDIAALLLFGGIMILAFKFLRKEKLIIFLSGVYAAGLASLLFVANRPGISSFFFHYQASGSGSDQFFYAQTLLMYLPLTLLLFELGKRIKPRTLGVSLISVTIVFVLASGILSNAYFGAEWRNAGVYENAVGTFTDRAILACKHTQNDSVAVGVYPFDDGRFSVTLPKNDVCTSEIKKHQIEYSSLGLQLNNNDFFAVTADQTFTQTFKATQPNLNGIKLFVSTFGKTTRHGSYTMQLKDASCTSILRSATIPTILVDNAYYGVRFDEIPSSAGGMYCVTVVPPSGFFDPIALQKSIPGQYKEGQLTIRSSASESDIVFSPLYASKVR